MFLLIICFLLGEFLTGIFIYYLVDMRIFLFKEVCSVKLNLKTAICYNLLMYVLSRCLLVLKQAF